MAKKYILIILILTLIILPGVFAITANSSSYSVGMFGTGMATATPSSTSYNLTILSEAQGTTRNAESSSYTTNIGFFDDVIYHRTVSITSYTIYPISAVQGSIVSLAISALNSQSVWAVLTLPDSSSAMISLVNNVNSYYTANSIGTYTVTFYANSSQGNIASASSTFEITSPVTSTPSGGGGGGTTTIIKNCTYIWDCSAWSICEDNYQNRECKNTGTCIGTEGKPLETRICSDALFDVVMEFNDLALTQNGTLKFNIDLTETKGIEKIDVQIKYSVLNSNNTEVFSLIETRAVLGNLSYEKEIEKINLIGGEYTLRVDIIYGNKQRAFAEQKFMLGEGKELKIIESESIIGKMRALLEQWGYLMIIALLVLAVFYLLFKLKEKIIKKDLRIGSHIIKRNWKKYLSYALGIIVIIGLIITAIKTNAIDIIRNIIELIMENMASYKAIALGSLGAIIFLVLLIIFIKKLVEGDFRKHPANSLKGLMHRKAYSETGNYIGKVDEIILGENRIDSIKIKLDKKHKFKAKGIVIEYKCVKSVGEVVIIDSKVIEHIKK